MEPGVGVFLWLLMKYCAEVKLPQVPSSHSQSRLRLAVRRRDSDYVLKYARPTMEVDARTQHGPRDHCSVESPQSGRNSRPAR